MFCTERLRGLCVLDPYRCPLRPPYALFSTGVVAMTAVDPGVGPDVGMEVATILEQYGEEIRRCRYGSFRGVIKDGRIVIFAVEQEWRPEIAARRQAAERPR